MELPPTTSQFFGLDHRPSHGGWQVHKQNSAGTKEKSAHIQMPPPPYPLHGQPPLTLAVFCIRLIHSL